ncbi:uncharacterized protein MYCFIDRAFT_175802 [Pseudocercospora fijiensis CIRAD86]|uniref:Uncharacterized protein n=1 Tax=Pseudocercospora fijiensis (strain CIRAD86) TaxID=383855 RepID=M3AYL0_PSEFD|nr:uncharacterized protein MYCFIDRAFT_175802 [Pseudocercospora fijiensis CIRAD86]EME82257.1 hypothetical protein MYCFIDRAFT_175802 [Pseudocercospora fijiensis CIRAD86]
MVLLRLWQASSRDQLLRHQVSWVKERPLCSRKRHCTVRRKRLLPEKENDSNGLRGPLLHSASAADLPFRTLRVGRQCSVAYDSIQQQSPKLKPARQEEWQHAVATTRDL